MDIFRKRIASRFIIYIYIYKLCSIHVCISKTTSYVCITINKMTFYYLEEYSSNTELYNINNRFLVYKLVYKLEVRCITRGMYDVCA